MLLSVLCDRIEKQIRLIKSGNQFCLVVNIVQRLMINIYLLWVYHYFHYLTGLWDCADKGESLAIFQQMLEDGFWLAPDTAVEFEKMLFLM